MPSSAFYNCQSAFSRVNGLFHVGRAFEGYALGGVDLSEAFRASLVMAISALDSYIHDLCVEALVESYCGARSRNSAFAEVKVRLTAAELGVPTQSPSWLAGELRAQFSRETYQRPDDVAKALRFVDDERNKWARIGNHMALSAHDVKTELGSIVDRRNMIVHEADLDPLWGTVRPLSVDECERAVAFISDLVNAIETECW